MSSGGDGDLVAGQEHGDEAREEAPRKQGPSRSRDMLVLALVVIVGLVAVAGFGFYQDEVKSYFRLQGWNLRPVTDATRDFLQAAARGEGDRVASMIDPNAAGVQVVKEDGKVTAVQVADYGGPRTVALKELAPSESPEIGSPTVVPINGGSVSLAARFPGSHALQMMWDRFPDGWKLKDVGWVAGGG